MSNDVKDMYKIICRVIVYTFLVNFICCQESVGLQPGDFSLSSNASSKGVKSRSKCKEYEEYATEDCTDWVQRYGLPPAEPPSPHLATVGFEADGKTEWLCSGSLISDQFVLTAAHCLRHQHYGEPKYVKIGDLDNDDKKVENSQQFSIEERIRHPDFKPPSVYNDIALIKLDRKAKLDDRTRPACLDTMFFNTTVQLIAAGSEKTDSLQRTNKAQYRLILEYVANNKCYDAYKTRIGIRLKHGIDEESQICAHGESKDDCQQTDSGGPLQTYNPERPCMYNIVGVTLFGMSCGTYAPSVYTRVSNYIDWIEEIVWP